MSNRSTTAILAIAVALVLTGPAWAGKGGVKGKGETAGEPASAPEYDRTNQLANQFLLRGSQDHVNRIAEKHGLTVLSSELPELSLLSGPEWMTASQIYDLIKDEKGLKGFEPIELASLPEDVDSLSLDQSTMAILEAELSKGASARERLASFFSTPLWTGYSEQPITELLGLHVAHDDKFGGVGNGVVVAVIDSGVDPGHPLLRDALVPGYDFLLDEPGLASEWAGLDQSTMAILEEHTTATVDQSTMAILEGGGQSVWLDQSTMAILEQSTMAILEGVDLPPAFGHGTMVAGLVRLGAPGAFIMPLRAFDGHGRAHLFDIVRAIYYAVDHGADVINMSFSMESASAELEHALRYAKDRGVVCVAAAGNRGQRTVVYPAGFRDALGVASTTLLDTASPFSNFGTDMVFGAAPGEGVVTAFPGGGFALAWGTSFSTPLVSGVAALLAERYTGDKIREFLAGAGKEKDYLGADFGNGRMDFAKAVSHGKPGQVEKVSTKPSKGQGKGR